MLPKKNSLRDFTESTYTHAVAAVAATAMMVDAVATAEDTAARETADATKMT